MSMGARGANPGGEQGSPTPRGRGEEMTETQHLDPSRYPVYHKDGVTYYRASAIGGCINELVLFYKGELGEDRNPYIEAVMEAGNEYEGPVRTQVAQKADMNVTLEHEAVQLWVDDENCVVGNTDGRLETAGNGGAECGAEIKTLGESSFTDFVKTGLAKFPEYQWQLSVYMHWTGLPFVYAAAPRYREKMEGGEWRFWVEPGEVHVLGMILDPPIPLNRIKRKVKRIQTLAQMEMTDLPVCEKAKFCSMVRFHDLIGGNVDAEQGELLSPEDELYDLVVRRIAAKAKEDAAAKERKEIDEELKLLMEGPAKIEGMGRLVPILQRGRTSYDTKRMVLDGLDLEPYEKQGSPFVSLRWYEEK